MLTICFFFPLLASTQDRKDFFYIDAHARSVKTAPVPQLSQALTEPFQSDLEKVRSIFTWIAENISYRTKKRIVTRKVNYTPAPVDTGRLKSANEMVAEAVLRDGSAVCEGYSRLFKLLCDHAGIRAEIITGYGRSSLGRVAAVKFRSNHYWNAVKIDSAWYLLDITWASGYLNYYGDEFIKNFNDYYFMTPPNQFIQEHLPDDMNWTLLSQPPVLQEFFQSPFRQRSFSKYNVVSFTPSSGIIEAAIGDTLQFELETTTAVSDIDKKIAPDTATLAKDMQARYASAIFLEPAGVTKNKKLTYTYVVTAGNAEWLHVMYNNDVLLRYQLRIRQPGIKPEFAVNGHSDQH